MKRNIVKIDEERCNGCGLCVSACHEGALIIKDGKAVLVSDSYCDGLGACLPECPEGAITIEEREALPFDENLVHNKKSMDIPACPGSRECHQKAVQHNGDEDNCSCGVSELTQWPVQLKLVSPYASFLDNAKLLVAADCTAYAYANIHKDFMKGKVTLIGCPKLDDEDYSERLTEILMRHDIRSITVLRMEVPCCGGIAYAVKNAMVRSGKLVPWNVVTIGTDGSIVDE